jgi:hypothetical protein
MKKVVITTADVKAAMAASGKRTMTGRARRKLVRQLREQKMSKAG